MSKMLRSAIATAAIVASSLGVLGAVAAPAGALNTTHNACNSTATVCYHYYKLVSTSKTTYWQRYAIVSSSTFRSACDFVPGTAVTCGSRSTGRSPLNPNGYYNHHPVYAAGGKWFVCGVLGCSQLAGKPKAFTTAG